MNATFMTVFDAVMIVEGEHEADEAKQLEAWQLLVDSGVCWQLQGRIGRAAADLIARGLIRS